MITSDLKATDRADDRASKEKSRAERVRTALHQQYDLIRPVTRSTAKPNFDDSDDAEDFWNNVPV